MKNFGYGRTDGRQQIDQVEHAAPGKLSERALPHENPSSGCEGQPSSEHIPQCQSKLTYTEQIKYLRYY